MKEDIGEPSAFLFLFYVFFIKFAFTAEISPSYFLRHG